MKYIYIFINFSLLIAPLLTYSDEEINGDFHFLLWPDRGGWIHSVTDAEMLTTSLRDSWYSSRLPTYIGYNLQIHVPKSDSLETYVEFILNHKPQCIEGEAALIKEEINRNTVRYRPILQLRDDLPSNSPHAEIVFHEEKQWNGVLGVVHPALPNAGKAQIEYWKQETGEEPDWIAFYSTEETIRHFLAGPRGNLTAAALPGHSLERFLKKIERKDLLEHLHQLTVPSQKREPTLYLRDDLYQNVLTRTLITETWLRNHFSDALELVY